MDTTSELLVLTRALNRPAQLEQILQLVVDCGVRVLKTPRVSIRLFDPTHTRLLATCRAGKPLHQNATAEYRRGEGLIGWIAEHVEPLRSGDAEADPRFAARPDMVEKMGSFLGAPVVIDTTCIGVISAVNAEPAFFTAHDEELLQLMAGLCAPHIEVARLSRVTQIDALTGAFNRRGLELAFGPTQVETIKTLVMVDIDHFKAINDRLGHATGDEVLRRVARLLSEVVRAQDWVIRMGGEEFLLVLPGIDLHRGALIANRVREAIAATHLKLDAGVVQLTVSAGVAEQKPGESQDLAAARADAALYRAKSAGRNQVQLADPAQ